jgi:hypothetical protein
MDFTHGYRIKKNLDAMPGVDSLGMLRRRQRSRLCSNFRRVPAKSVQHAGCTRKNIQIHFLRNAFYTTFVGVLPEIPAFAGAEVGSPSGKETAIRRQPT